MRKIVLSILFIVLSISVFSQNDVAVNVEYDAVGDAHLIANNYTKLPVYVIVDFTYLRYSSFAEELPFVKRVEPGTTELFLITKEFDQPSPEVGLELKFRMAHTKPDSDPDFPYLIPSIPNSKVEFLPIAETGDIINSTVAKYGIGFKIIGGNVVCASRTGIVLKMIKNSFPQQNYLLVLHNDGTIAEYFNFARNKIIPAVGDKVFAGQIIGQANNSADNSSIIGFTVGHSLNQSDNIKYIVPKFLIAKESIEKNSSSLGTIIVLHPIKIITDEMTRKERKSFEKANKK